MPTNEQIMELADRYRELFGMSPPMPACITLDCVFEEVRKAIEAGKPIPDHFDWWDYLDGPDTNA